VAGTKERHQWAAVGIASSTLYTISSLREYTFFHRKACLKIDTRSVVMQFLLLLLIILLLILGMYGYQLYRANAARRAKEKRRNQYHDRV
jgi:hypothetical protein